MTPLAKYVKDMRRQYGLTQIDLSEKAGVGLRFVRELEQEKKSLRLEYFSVFYSRNPRKISIFSVAKTIVKEVE